MTPSPAARVLVFMEANEFTGPAKNLAATSKLLADKVDFRVVAFIRGDAPSTEFTEQIIEHGLACEVIRERFRYDPRAVTQFRRAVKSYQPDILQIHNAKSRLYVYVLSRLGLLGNPRTIYCYHGETWTNTKQMAYNKLDRWLFRRAKNIIVVSQQQKRLLEDFGVPPDRVTVIYNGIQPRASSLRKPRVPLNLITVGRLSREKGQAILLKAARLLRDRGVAAFELTVVGGGPDVDALKRSAVEDGVADIVHFTGYQPDPTPYYEAADLYVLPSLTEGVPNVLLESAMHHVPIVSTNVGGVPEMFEDSIEALLVPPDDAAALADAVERCIGDENLRRRLATAARARVERQFTDDQRARQYLDYYKTLIANPD